MAISLFDLDRTLLHSNSSFSFCFYLYRKKVLPISTLFFSFFYYIWHHFFSLSLEQLHQKVFKNFLHGMQLSVLEGHAEEFVDRYLEDLIYVPAWERLKLAQHQGHFTGILSSSPSFLVRVIAKKLSVDIWEASEYRVDKDQKLCQIQRVLQGEEKAFCVKRISKDFGICLEKTIGYSDSHLDLPFLVSVGKAVVVNPDYKLRKEAKERNWEEI